MGLAVGTAKYLLFFFNFIFFITGIVIIAIGAVVLSNVQPVGEHMDTEFRNAPVLLIVVGSFVAIISFFGCCGAIRHSYCMLITFSVLLALIFILELAAGIAAYVEKDEVLDGVEQALLDSMKDYATGGNTTKEWWNDLQKADECCGVHNYTDWENKTITGVNFTFIPDTCCQQKKDCTSDNVYTHGCLQTIKTFFSENITRIGGVGVGIAFIQILGIVFACCLASAVKTMA